jgi:hypothetical protein
MFRRVVSLTIDHTRESEAEVYMRKVVLVLGICLLAAPAWAGGGYSLFGSYAQITDDAEAPGAGVRLTLGSGHWVGDLTATWYNKESDVPTIAGFQDDLQVVPFDLGVRFLTNPSGGFNLYFGGGLTYFWTSLNDASISDEFGLHALVGFTVGKSRTKFFAEGNYRYADCDVSYRVSPDQTIDDNLEVGGFGVNAGVVWTF